MGQLENKPIAIGSMKLRDLGNSYGFTVDKNALEDLGLLDENDELVGEISARSVVYDDGTIEYELDVE